MSGKWVRGAVGLLVALGALFFVIHKKKDEGKAAPPRPAEGSAVVVATGTPGAPPAPSLPGSGDAPALAAGSAEQNPRDYVVGDVRVRDHRAGDNKPLDVPPSVHPAESRVIPSSLTNDVAQKVRAVMNDCAAQVPREARGASPRLEGQIVVNIKDHQLAVSQATMQLRDVFGAALEPTRQCIEQKSVGLTTAAPDQADLANYSISITFAVP